jgi:hypothetical protein
MSSSSSGSFVIFGSESESDPAAARRLALKLFLRALAIAKGGGLADELSAACRVLAEGRDLVNNCVGMPDQ